MIKYTRIVSKLKHKVSGIFQFPYKISMKEEIERNTPLTQIRYLHIFIHLSFSLIPATSFASISFKQIHPFSLPRKSNPSIAFPDARLPSLVASRPIFLLHLDDRRFFKTTSKLHLSLSPPFSVWIGFEFQSAVTWRGERLIVVEN